jgi:hypothetical protein
MKVEPPHRVVHEYRQSLEGTPEEVFPLLCPVRETEWVAGWDPLVVWSETGFAEEECVFLTFHESGQESVWLIDLHDPDGGRLDILKVTPGLIVTRIRIRLTASSDTTTTATIRYSHTALSADGKHLVDSFTRDEWIRFMQRWEAALNHYLRGEGALRE